MTVFFTMTLNAWLPCLCGAGSWQNTANDGTAGKWFPVPIKGKGVFYGKRSGSYFLAAKYRSKSLMW